MTIPLKPPIEIVTSAAHLSSAVRVMLGLKEIGLDTESNSLHHYPEQLCLIQIATGQTIYVIDAINLQELAPIKLVLENTSIVKIIHSADNDIRSLDRHHGFRISNVYDTMVAAHFCGLEQIGLAATIEDMLGATIPKTKRLQKSDWGQRPLSREALDYAASDVSHLFDLKKALDKRLQVLGRTEWVAEECARLEDVRYTAPNQETAYLSIKRAKDLDGRGLSVLRSLCLFREKEAQRLHRPPFFVIPDGTLFSIAENPSIPLSRVPSLGQIGLHRFGHGLQQAIRDGLAVPPITWQPRYRPERMSPEEARRLSGLKAWRLRLGGKLCMDPSLVWPLASLERLAIAPDTLVTELASPEVRCWQRDYFGSALRAHLAA